MSIQHEQNRRAGSRTRSGELRAGPGVRSGVALGSQNVLPSGSRRPERAIDFAELGDGTLAEVVEDPMNPSRTRFAIFNQGRVRFADQLEYGGEIFVPIPRSVVGFSDVKLPCGVLPYGSVKRLIGEVLAFIKYGADISISDIGVLAAFVLYSWLADRLLPAVYLSIIGLPQSGKSTLLELLSMICRQPLLVSDISEAAVFRTCHQFSPTLIIDEVEWHSSRTSRLRQLLRAGIGRASRALRIGDCSSSFGPKVFSSLEPSTDAALNSRCLQIVMAETMKRKLVKPGDPRMVSLAKDLRQMLLKFRFNSYRSIGPAPLLGAENLRPRSRDLFCSLAAPVRRSRIIVVTLSNFVKRHHDPVTREPLGPRQDALLSVLFQVLHHHPPAGSVRVKFLAETTNALLQRSGEKLALTDKATGTILSTLGFKSKCRTNQGWILWFDSDTQKRAHQLLQTHGIARLEPGTAESFAKSCSACQTIISPNGSSKTPGSTRVVGPNRDEK
jgi:hypothetical protein